MSNNKCFRRLILFFIVVVLSSDVLLNCRERSKKYGFLDLKGTIAVEPVYENATDFEAKMSIVVNEGITSIIDINKQNLFVLGADPSLHYKISSNGLIAFGKYHKENPRRGMGYISQKGETVIPFDYFKAERFYEDLAVVIQPDGSLGVINNKNEFVIKPGRFKDIGRFSEGRAAVLISKIEKEDRQLNPEFGFIYLTKWKFIDTKGEFISDNAFSGCAPFSDGMAIVEKGGYSIARTFHERIHGKYGFIDASGEIVIKPKYYFVRSFQRGFAPVCKERGKPWLYINKKGKKVFGKTFNKAQEFTYDGLAAVALKDKYGFIDTKGDLVIPCLYDDVKGFSEGFAAVKIRNKWGYIDKKGNYIVEPKFDEAFSFSDGMARIGIEVEIK